MDHLSPKDRSLNMSKIRSKDTKPEVLVRKLLWGFGYRYRKNVNKLPGKPDIVISSKKTAIFVNGCFWHQHKNCKRQSMPKTNTSYWVEKLLRNVRKQANNIRTLRKLGWRVLVIWECQTNNSRLLRSKLAGI